MKDNLYLCTNTRIFENEDLCNIIIFDTNRLYFRHLFILQELNNVIINILKAKYIYFLGYSKHICF